MGASVGDGDGVGDGGNDGITVGCSGLDVGWGDGLTVGGGLVRLLLPRLGVGVGNVHGVFCARFTLLLPDGRSSVNPVTPITATHSSNTM